MYPSIKNLVFEGGGILSIAYLGALDFLDEIGILNGIERVAGASSGAVTACLTSFNLPITEIKILASSLDYKKMPKKDSIPFRSLSSTFKAEFEKIFGDINSVYRLLRNYGWYSADYFYNWIKKTIASQFDPKKKKPPYTFEDFKNRDMHINNRPFKDLYIMGTDISYKTPVIFSYETTPKMEVAEAVKISMSIPLFFEASKINNGNSNKAAIYADGGLMHNYPINIFDYNGVNYETLGLQFINKTKYGEINNIIDYIENLFHALLKLQEDIYNNNPIYYQRSININVGGISSLDFNISDNDYRFLYNQGYYAAEDYFANHFNFIH